MEPENLIGKEFITFEFKDYPKLTYTRTYEQMVGLPAIVLNLHSRYSEYANAQITFPDGKIKQYHYPADMIIKQLEENEINNIDIDQIFLEIRRLTHFR